MEQRIFQSSNYIPDISWKQIEHKLSSVIIFVFFFVLCSVQYHQSFLFSFYERDYALQVWRKVPGPILHAKLYIDPNPFRFVQIWQSYNHSNSLSIYSGSHISQQRQHIIALYYVSWYENHAGIGIWPLLKWMPHVIHSAAVKYSDGVAMKSHSIEKYNIDHIVTHGISTILLWHHSGRDCVSNQQSHHCLLNCLLRSKSKKQQRFASLAFVRGIHRSSVNSRHTYGQ